MRQEHQAAWPGVLTLLALPNREFPSNLLDTASAQSSHCTQRSSQHNPTRPASTDHPRVSRGSPISLSEPTGCSNPFAGAEGSAGHMGCTTLALGRPKGSLQGQRIYFHSQGCFLEVRAKEGWVWRFVPDVGGHLPAPRRFCRTGSSVYLGRGPCWKVYAGAIYGEASGHRESAQPNGNPGCQGLEAGGGGGGGDPP